LATWTQADIDKLSRAIVALASGEGIQSVSYDGPPRRTVTYQAQDLGKMRDLLAAMSQAVARAAGRPSYRLIGTRKGM
jgi:hypothetical protein